MSIFSKIFKATDKQETVADVQRLIVDLEREEAGARRTVQEIDVRRAALLVSGDDKQLDADRIAKERAERTLERVSLARSAMVERLTAAQQRARTELLIELRAERSQIIDRLHDAMHIAVDANEAAMAFNEKARALLGESAAPDLTAPFAYPLLQRSMIEPWAAYLAQTEGPVHRPATVQAPVAAAPIKAKAKIASAPAAELPGCRLPAQAQVPAGSMRIVIIRGGVELSDGSRPKVGDILDVPGEEAMSLLRSAAADCHSGPVSVGSEQSPEAVEPTGTPPVDEHHASPDQPNSSGE